MAKKDPGGEVNAGARELERLRKACRAMPLCEERLSHGEPTFFAGKSGVFAAFSNNHHGDGHVAALLPAAPGVQEEMIAESPGMYYRPPYVGCKGWVGVELARVKDGELAELVQSAWRLITEKKKTKTTGAGGTGSRRR